MRTFLAFFCLLLLPYLVFAQDPGMQAAQAAQQAAQQAMQANQQAMQAAQQANQQAMQAMQQAQQNADTFPPQPCCIAFTAAPKFSLKGGKYSGPTTVKITDASRGAVIYYTTDGWAPTENSPRYRGPIEITSTTTLQAIAVAPYSVRSFVASAKFEIAGVPANSANAALVPPPNAPPNATLVPLVFDADVSSKTASVGDKIPLTLSEDLLIGNLMVKKGSPATATVTAVDPTGAGGAPGVITFEVDSLQSDIGPIVLSGGATREGDAKPPNAAILIPLVGPFIVFKHGTDAVITKGTPFTAYIDPNTPVASVR